MEIYKAWKKEMAEGSIPVGPGGMTTSMLEIYPTLAGAETLFFSMMGLSSKTDLSVKMNPTLF